MKDRLPPDYHQTLVPAQPSPPFHDPDELERVWGRAWGASDEVGPLREVLVRPPAGPEFKEISKDHYLEAADALVDPNGAWYWTGKKPPDIGKIKDQHAQLVQALKDENVIVHELDPLPARFAKQIYVRDPVVTLRGGAVVGRLAPRMRRGEEADLTKAVARLGLPILRTISGTGLLEGGSFCKLRPGHAVVGTSVRVNDIGAGQLGEALMQMGWQLMVLPLGGFTIHIDLHLLMLDQNKALVDPTQLPYWFVDHLRELDIDPVWSLPEEPWALNGLTLRPNRVLIADNCPGTVKLLERYDVQAVTIPYDEIHKNGGGIHCSTMEILRDDVQ